MGQPTDAFLQLFENEYKYSLDTAKSIAEQTNELNNLILQFNSDLEQKIESSQIRVEEVYTRSVSEFELVSTLLSQLRTENRDLKEIWNDIEKGGEDNWIDSIDKLREISYENEQDNFKRFIQNHPQYPQIQPELEDIGSALKAQIKLISLNEALFEKKPSHKQRVLSHTLLLANILTE